MRTVCAEELVAKLGRSPVDQPFTKAWPPPWVVLLVRYFKAGLEPELRPKNPNHALSDGSSKPCFFASSAELGSDRLFRASSAAARALVVRASSFSRRASRSSTKARRSPSGMGFCPGKVRRGLLQTVKSPSGPSPASPTERKSVWPAPTGAVGISTRKSWLAAVARKPPVVGMVRQLAVFSLLVTALSDLRVVNWGGTIQGFMWPTLWKRVSACCQGMMLAASLSAVFGSPDFQTGRT